MRGFLIGFLALAVATAQTTSPPPAATVAPNDGELAQASYVVLYSVAAAIVVIAVIGVCCVACPCRGCGASFLTDLDVLFQTQVSIVKERVGVS